MELSPFLFFSDLFAGNYLCQNAQRYKIVYQYTGKEGNCLLEDHHKSNFILQNASLKQVEI